MENVTNQTMSQIPNYTAKEKLNYVLVMLGLSIWILCSNVLVLLAIRRTPRLQNKTGIFIASLAVADLLCGLLLMPSFLLGSSWLPKHGARYVCGMYISMQVLPLLASITNLVLIGFERYLAIVHPLKSRGFLTKKRCCQLVIGAWIIPGILSLIIIPWNGYIPNPGKKPVCSSRHMDKIYFFTIIYISFWGLLLVLVYFYVAIIRTVSGHHKFVRQHSIDTSREKLSHERRKYRTDIKLAKMVMLVLGVFCVCWIPRILSLSFHYLGLSNLTFLMVSGLISFINSGMNMVLYTARNKHYRRAFKNIILCRKTTTQQDVGSSQDSTSQRLKRRINRGSSSSLKTLGTLVQQTTPMLAPQIDINDSTSSLRALGCSEDDPGLTPSLRSSRGGSDSNLNSLKKTVRFSGDMVNMLTLKLDSERKTSNSSLCKNGKVTLGNRDSCLSETKRENNQSK